MLNALRQNLDSKIILTNDIGLVKSQGLITQNGVVRATPQLHAYIQQTNTQKARLNHHKVSHAAFL